MSASSFVGETSISSARSWARVRWVVMARVSRSGVAGMWRAWGSCVQVVDQLVHQARHEADRADRLGVRHPGRPEGADDADRPARTAVRGKDERDLAHLDRLVLVADEDADGVRP